MEADAPRSPRDHLRRDARGGAGRGALRRGDADRRERPHHGRRPRRRALAHRCHQDRVPVRRRDARAPRRAADPFAGGGRDGGRRWPMKPGEVIFGDGTIVLNAGRATVDVEVENTSDHTIFISSHFPFFEVNRRLVFDRARAWGMHLDVPAGDSMRWRPDRKSTRLNSSHITISYAVFCLKKKTTTAPE